MNQAKQHDRKDCGPACLKFIANSYGKFFTLKSLRATCNISREGVSLLGVSKAAEKIGFKSQGVKISLQRLKTEAKLPCITLWDQSHFIVIRKIRKKKVYVFDPAFGNLTYSTNEFLSKWSEFDEGENSMGICLLLEPGYEFLNQKGEKKSSLGFAYLWSYFKEYKRFMLQLMSGIVVAILIQLIIPLITQSIVDLGINNQNFNFITLALIAILVLVVSQISVEYYRNKTIVHLNSRLNFSVLSDFLKKLLNLPISFFESRHIGDLLQRVGDQAKVERFLTSTLVSGIYVTLNVLVFSLVLAIYSTSIFLIFLIGFCFSVAWIWRFMKKREELDFKRFSQQSETHKNIVQMFNGINDIRLFNNEQYRRWEWEETYAKYFNTSIKNLSIDQYQRSGAVLINQLKNLLIIFIVANSVIQGSMTLGMMIAIMFILGQLNNPINQLVAIFKSLQETRLSLQRLGEIMQYSPEEDQSGKIQFLPDDLSVRFKNISFGYQSSENVLNNIGLSIPQGKVTAIVGESGCGKTTLLKLLLGFYTPNSGSIHVGNIGLNSIHPDLWRSRCSAVLQDGYIFSDSIMNNIIMHDNDPDYNKLLKVTGLACLNTYIESLPLSYQTKIGQDGRGLSTGQKQRILIARALYRDFDFLFLDEATNSLDAENESMILQNLRNHLQNKTVVVIAHRLSTIRSADQIVVMDRGKIVEIGTHNELLYREGKYYHLINKQTDFVYET